MVENSTGSDRHDERAAGNCPSHDVLFQFLQSRLSEDQARRIAVHLDACPRCLAGAEDATSRGHWLSDLQLVQQCMVDVADNEAINIPHDSSVGVNVSSDQEIFARSAIPVLNTDRFRNLTPIGRGGCANVFRADDTALGRVVALKIPHASLFADSAAAKRFQTELRATALLHHPHIVALYDAGFDDHQGYIVFEHIAGPTLAEWLARQTIPVSVQVAATIVAQLADGVEHAHAAGILHRDLKPSNVLLDETRQSDGLPFTPRIADFGIARFLDSDVTHTIHDTILGSPPFMSPEQAQGDRNRIGPASDVYALGGILYQLLTQRLPIAGSGVADTLRRVVTDEPTPPHRYRQEIPRDLEAICLKCLEKDPQRRYAAAQELGADLQRYLDGEPVSVRPPTPAESLFRVARRHPAWTALTGIVAAAAALVIVLLTRHSSEVVELADELGDKNAQLTSVNEELTTARDEARHAVYAYDMRAAFDAAEKADARMVRSLLDRYADGSELSSYRSIDWEYLWLRANLPHREILNLADAVYMAKLSPDGKTLAVVGADARIRLCDFASGQIAAEWPSGQGELNGIRFSPDGERLWTAGDDGTVVCWSRATRQRLYTIEAHKPALAFEIVYDSRRGQIITCGREGTIRVWDAETGAARGVFEGHQRAVDTIHLHPDSQALFSQSMDGTIRMWNVESRECQRTVEMITGEGVVNVCPSPDGRWLAALSKESGLILYVLPQFAEVLRVPEANEPRRVCFDPESRRLFIGDVLGTIEEWSLTQEPGTAVEDAWSPTGRNWYAHQTQVSHLEWSPQSGELISTSRDGRVLAWQNMDEAMRYEFDISHREIRDFVGIPGDNRLLCVSEEGVTLDLIVEDADGATANARILDAEARWYWGAVSRDGKTLAAGADIGWVALWRNRDDRPYVHTAALGSTDTHWLTFTADGRHVCWTVLGGEPAMWIDASTGEMERLPLANPCHQLEFSPDGKLFAVTYEKTLRIVDLATRQTLCELKNPSLYGKTIQFFPDGKAIALADERKVRIHDVRTGSLLKELLGHEGLICGMAVSADGRTLATSSADGSVRLWHVPTGQNTARFTSFASDNSRCCLIDNDRWLAFSLTPNDIRVVRIR
ncbi:MAG: protein kinase [Planctomycetaceae bacterium]